jgi:hypothetical protein
MISAGDKVDRLKAEPRGGGAQGKGYIGLSSIINQLCFIHDEIIFLLALLVA